MPRVLPVKVDFRRPPFGRSIFELRRASQECIHTARLAQDRIGSDLQRAHFLQVVVVRYKVRRRRPFLSVRCRRSYANKEKKNNDCMPHHWGIETEVATTVNMRE